MFKLDKQINNESKAIYVFNEQIISFKKLDNKTVIDFVNADTLNVINSIDIGFKTMHIFFSANNNIFLYWPLQRLLKINEKYETEKIDLEWNFAPDILIQNIFIGVSKNKAGTYSLSKYNLSTNKIEIIINSSFRIWGSYENVIFGVKTGIGNEIYAIDINSNEILWQKTFIDNLNGKIFFHKKQIVLLSPKHIFCLNIHTGQEIWDKKNNDRLILKEDKLINLTSKFLKEISLDTGKTDKEYDMSDEYDRTDIRFMGTNNRYAVSHSNIFIGQPFTNKIAAINRENGKIGWVEKTPNNESIIIDSPLIIGDNVYYLDDKGSIYKYSPQH